MALGLLGRVEGNESAASRTRVIREFVGV